MPLLYIILVKIEWVVIIDIDVLSIRSKMGVVTWTDSFYPNYENSTFPNLQKFNATSHPLLIQFDNNYQTTVP